MQTVEEEEEAEGGTDSLMAPAPEAGKKRTFAEELAQELKAEKKRRRKAEEETKALKVALDQLQNQRTVVVAADAPQDRLPPRPPMGDARTIVEHYMQAANTGYLQQLFKLLPSSLLFAYESENDDVKVVACNRETLTWTRAMSEVYRLFERTLLAEARAAILQHAEDKAAAQQAARALGVEEKLVVKKLVSGPLRDMLELEGRQVQLDSKAELFNFEDKVVVNNGGMLTIRERRYDDYVSKSNGVVAADWIVPSYGELTPERKALYDQLIHAQRKSLCDADVRNFMQTAMGHVFFRFNEATRSKTFFMMVSGHDCGKSGFLQMAMLAGGEYVCPINKAQLSKSGGELAQASAIAGGHRLVLLDDSAERGKLDMTAILSTFTNVNQAVVRKPFGHHTRTIESTPCLMMALNWKAMDQGIGKDERVKAALVTEEAFDGARRFMGRFVPRDDDVDEDEGIFLQDPAFKQWGDPADKQWKERKGAAARLCYKMIVDAPHFDPVRDYPQVLREGRDEHWDYYVQKGKRSAHPVALSDMIAGGGPPAPQSDLMAVPIAADALSFQDGLSLQYRRLFGDIFESDPQKEECYSMKEIMSAMATRSGVAMSAGQDQKQFAMTMLRAGQDFPHDSVVVPKFYEKASKPPRKNNVLYVKYKTIELRDELSSAD